MVWSATLKFDLLNKCKLLAINMGQVISRKTDLGQPIDGYLDYYYFICNITFAIEEDYYYIGTTGGFTDDEYDVLYGFYTKMLIKHNRFKGF